MRIGWWSTMEVQLSPNVRGTSPEDKESALEEAIYIGGGRAAVVLDGEKILVL